VTRLGATGVGDVVLRPARLEDCVRIWEWRNDPETRHASFHSAPIPLETHEAWFRASLGRVDRRLYVIVVHGRECGSARLDFAGGEAEVSIHLAPEYRGRGIGPAALERLAETAFGELELGRLVARVKADNAASLAAFARAGFTRVANGAAIILARASGERA
jgi:UDP-2,4-diacetamido-2,4,6-trideoxy-beta-L-altropyranose hydrolase